jgi:c-di-GMP-binding flagellar brake protein YcgR
LKAEEKLKLEVGDMLQLQFSSSEQRFYCKVIGYMEGVSILITTPQHNGRTLMVREGIGVSVRMISGVTMYGFKTTIRHSCLKPFPYLHLAYPKEMEQSIVRKAQRIRVKMLVTVEVPAIEAGKINRKTATILDLSSHGALLSSSEKFANKGEMITIRAKLQMANAQELIAIPAIVRNVREVPAEGEEGPSIQYGVEFEMGEGNEIILLHGYIYERMMRRGN